MPEQRLENLNLAVIDNADGPDVHFPSVRTPTFAFDRSIEVHFDNLESVLVKEIVDSPVVVGCVAWLTNERVLRALTSCESVSIIVNKEDFLRPDKGNWSQRKIKDLYRALRSTERFELGADYSVCGDPTLEAIRCAGVCGDRKNVPPRMHHKFFVFCKWRYERLVYDQVVENFGANPQITEVASIPDRRDGWAGGDTAEYRTRLRPVSVWTGSFNASENGTKSLENVLIVRDEMVAAAYLSEWQTILGISEPLDWSSVHVYPEWRLGT